LHAESETVGAHAEAEAILTNKFIENLVYVAAGAQYHHPIPGHFRFTFALEAKALQIGLSRIESTLGLKDWIKQQPTLDVPC
jgi:hypothetical protein